MLLDKQLFNLCVESKPEAGNPCATGKGPDIYLKNPERESRGLGPLHERA